MKTLLAVSAGVILLVGCTADEDSLLSTTPTGLDRNPNGSEEDASGVGPIRVTIDGGKISCASASHLGFVLFYGTGKGHGGDRGAGDGGVGDGPQVVLLERSDRLLVALKAGEQVEIEVPIHHQTESAEVGLRLEAAASCRVEVDFHGDQTIERVALQSPDALQAKRRLSRWPSRIVVRAIEGEPALWIDSMSAAVSGKLYPIDLRWPPGDEPPMPPAAVPEYRSAVAEAMIQWDWRLQDGIGTSRAQRTYAQAANEVLRRGDALIAYLEGIGVEISALRAQWELLKQTRRQLEASADTDASQWEGFWLSVHRLRRRIAFANPQAPQEPIVFLKHLPGTLNIQHGQNLGRFAQPGGGVFVLEQPGRSMRLRDLSGNRLPRGSYQHLDLSFEADRALFAFCEVQRSPDDPRIGNPQNFFHLYEIALDGARLRQLTDGPYDDFAPRYMSDGRILFVSTRRGGYSRCGPDYSAVHTLCVAENDGSKPRVLSYHEIHEWDPALLNDGSIVYTRWDYVDRSATHYSHLWVNRSDGANPRILYGNNTLNPIGTFEARPIPGSNRIMATASAHHAITAGSIVLVDPAVGVDGPAPLNRLTPDALFPQSEWSINTQGEVERQEPGELLRQKSDGIEERLSEGHQRWPGHCYRSPFPLSEEVFLAAYSFKHVVLGEFSRNPDDLFGLYLVDRFGNKELLYRDLSLSSLWPAPARPRPRPPVAAPPSRSTQRKEGWVFMQDVYRADPPLPEQVRIKALRVMQIFPKTHPVEMRAQIGLPAAAVGRRVLGTVPVEEDGSAYFRVPAGVPLAFQGLDRSGRAVQMMRSITYLQPGETVGCVGCHEPRTHAPPTTKMTDAARRPASEITPGPDGSDPLSFPLLVQPVLDKHCVGCHNAADPQGEVDLTSSPCGLSPRNWSSEHASPTFSKSYEVLAEQVKFSEWIGDEDIYDGNSEPVTKPGFFGTLASPLTTLLEQGHGDVWLSDDEWQRLIIWMDANALFYGTFDEKDQARQLRGERIAGPSRN